VKLLSDDTFDRIMAAVAVVEGQAPQPPERLSARYHGPRPRTFQKPDRLPAAAIVRISAAGVGYGKYEAFTQKGSISSSCGSNNTPGDLPDGLQDDFKICLWNFPELSPSGWQTWRIAPGEFFWGILAPGFRGPGLTPVYFTNYSRGVRDFKWNSSNHAIQAAYKDAPPERLFDADFVDKIVAQACPGLSSAQFFNV
jgi:hypothetical protein